MAIEAGLSYDDADLATVHAARLPRARRTTARKSAQPKRRSRRR
jgi:hypothetical protein